MEQPEGMVIIMHMPENLALRNLAQEYNYSFPREKTPWMEKAIHNVLVRITRDDQEKLWSIRFTSSKITNDLNKAIKEVFQNITDSNIPIKTKGIFYFAKSEEKNISELGYKKNIKVLGDGSINPHIQFKDNQIQAHIIGKIEDQGLLQFYTQNLFNDLQKIGVLS